jgi:hypothetical protein
MRISIFIALTLVGLLSTACVTGYQSKGFNGGFQDTQLAPDVFRVSFSGNSLTSNDRVQDFAMLRAAELTLANDSQYFAVISSEDQSRTDTHMTYGSSQSVGIASGRGKTRSYSGVTSYSQPQVHTSYKPGVGLLIRTFQVKPESDLVFEANFIASSIRTKYGIK